MHIGFDWRDTDAATHMASFTVAKAANLDLLRDIRAELDRAIAEGVSFEDFRAELQPLLEKRGWWGTRELTDPRTGEAVTVRIGPRRLETIFRQNLAVSYMRGKWERIERLAEDRPFLRYSAVLDDRVRPDHADWHGVVLPYDDPWWRTHYPPNGWRCRGAVTQHDAESLERFGWEPSPTRPAHEGITRPWHNERTGEDLRVPVGIDPGWDHNVGLRDSVRAARSVLVEKAADAPVAVAQAALRDGWDSYAAAGRAVRETISNAVPGAPGEAAHAAAFHERLIATLRAQRGAGEIEANIEPAHVGIRHAKAAATVREASRVFPRRWIEEANKTPLRVADNGKQNEGSYYHRDWTGTPEAGTGVTHKTAGYAMIDTDRYNYGTALHEYTHHLQYTNPSLNHLFLDIHAARTVGHPATELMKGIVGREDQYVDPYFGREYAPNAYGAAREVVTMSMEYLLAPSKHHGWGWLAAFLRDDPGMVELAIGALMRYDP